MISTGLIILIISAFFIWLKEDATLSRWDKRNPFYKYYLKEFWYRSFDFTGKTTREFFWIGFLFWNLIFLLVIICGLSFYLELGWRTPLIFLSSIHLIVTIIPNISIQIRRLRDAGKSPALILLGLIPIVSLILIFWYASPSQSKQKNKSNPSDLENKLEEINSLLDRNIINEEEYKSIRKKILGI